MFCFHNNNTIPNYKTTGSKALKAILKIASKNFQYEKILNVPVGKFPLFVQCVKHDSAGLESLGYNMSKLL